MGVNPCARCKFVMGMICPWSMACGRIITKYEGLDGMCQRSVDIPMLKVVAIVVDRWCIHEIQAYVRMLTRKECTLMRMSKAVLSSRNVYAFTCPRCLVMVPPCESFKMKEHDKHSEKQMRLAKMQNLFVW